MRHTKRNTAQLLKGHITHHKTMAETMHGGARSMGLDTRKVTDYSTSVNPLGMHHTVYDKLKTTLYQSTEYPDIFNETLEQKMAKYLGIEPKYVTATNGATDTIYNVCRHVSQKPVLIQSPTFGEYVSAAKLYKCDTKLFQTDNITKDKDKFIQDIPQNGCVFVCNPAAPTGILAHQNTIHDIIKAGEDANAITVVDECFIELTPNRCESVLRHIKKHANLVIVRTMTKSFGLAGLRVGYHIANDTISERLRQYRIPWCIGTIAQAAAGQALKHPEHITNSHKTIRAEIPRMYDALSASPHLNPAHSDANYMVVRTKQPAVTVQKRLLKHNILVRDCTSFGMPYHIRISTKTGDKNKILCKQLIESCRV